MKCLPLIRNVFLALLLPLAAHPGHAADPQLYLTDSSVASIDSLELFRNGIYWWTGGLCSEGALPGGASFRAFTDARLEATQPLFGAAGGFGAGDLIQARSFLSDYSSGTMMALPPGCGYGPYLVRDDEAFYYARSGFLYRKPLTDSPSAEGDQLRALLGLKILPVTANGALWVTDSELWFYADDAQNSTVSVYRSGKRGLLTLKPAFTLPAAAIHKFAIANVVDSSGAATGSTVIALTPEGDLYLVASGGNPELYTRGVSDFAYRTESYITYTGPLHIPTTRHETRLYFALGNLVTFTAPGQLVGHSLTPGGRADEVEYNAGSGNKVTSVTADHDNIYLTRTFGSTVANSDLLRRHSPAVQTLTDLPDPDYSTIAVQKEFRSLRASGKFVYFVHGNTIQRLPTDAPAIVIDFESYGIEVTQGVQDLNNSVRLVAGKPAWVRGYVRVAANSTGRQKFDVPAQLRVYRVVFNAALEIPGSPFTPDNTPMIEAPAALSEVRTNLAATFNFQLPGEVLQAGTLRFQFILNPGRATPETEALGNNTAEADLPAVQTQIPDLVFVTMSSTFPNYVPSADPNFWNIIARAKTLLPVSGFNIRFHKDSLTKPVVTLTGLKSRSFTIPDDQNTALLWLDIARLVEQGVHDHSHYIGMFPPEVKKFNGLGRAPGNVLIARMASDTEANDTYNSYYGGRTLAHELGHNYGRQHVLTTMACSGSIPAGPYDILPDVTSGCNMGKTNLDETDTAVGFDPISWTIAIPSMNGDIMSYADTRWTSAFTWNALIDAMKTTAAPQSIRENRAGTGPYLLVDGLLNTITGAAYLAPAFTLAASDFSAATLAELTATPPGDSSIHLQLIGLNGSVLLDEAVAGKIATDSDEGTVLLHRALPFNPDAAQLRLLENNSVLAELAISAHTPEIQLLPPVVSAEKVKISWMASDADDDPLFFTIQYSADNGQSWQTESVHFPESAFSIDTSTLPGSDTARVRVIATDGARTAIAVSDPFAVAKHAPAAHIAGVVPGQQFDFGAPVTAEGFGIDAEDGSLSGAALKWTLEGPQPRAATGSSIALSSLAPGLYMLSLEATDSDGQTASDKVPFSVRSISIADGGEPVLDGLAADAAYASNPAVQLPYGSGLYANTRFAHANGALFVCFDGVQYGRAPAAASVGLRLNTFVADTGAAGFAVDENGGIYRLAGDDSGLTFLTNPSPGMKVVILRDQNTWSAEMRIEDALLGGWNHQLSMAVLADDGIAATAPVSWPPGADLDKPGTWSPGSAGTLPPLPRNGNLLPFGDAEGLPATDGYSASAIPGWTVTGNLTVISWGAPGGFPFASDFGPPDRGTNFFAGGQDSGTSTASTIVAVPFDGAEIDAGTVTAVLSGWLGGFGSQDDTASLTARMLDDAGKSLGEFAIGPVDAAERTNNTSLLYRETSRTLASGTRQLEVVLEMSRNSSVYNDGYADSLSLVLRTGPATAAPNLPPVARVSVDAAQPVPAGATVVLDGSGSTDPEGAPLTYTWRSIAGPIVSVASGDSAKPSFIAPALPQSTTLSFELIVSDGIQESAPARVDLTVAAGSQPPRVEIISEGFDAGAFVIRAAATGAGSVQLERTSALGSANWQPVGSEIPLLGETVDLRDPSAPSGESSAFYRIVLK